MCSQRNIMTRTDFLNDLDTWHIINIDRYHNVRPDSRLMLNVFREIAAQEGFQEDVCSGLGFRYQTLWLTVASTAARYYKGPHRRYRESAQD